MDSPPPETGVDMPCSHGAKPPSSGPLAKLASSTAGGCIVAVLMCPFDVVTRRTQALGGGAQSRGSIDMAMHIWRDEGPLALWRGLTPTVMMTVPATAFYFTVYGTLKQRFEVANDRRVPEEFVPLVAGPMARTLTVACTTPLELVRTNIQSYARRADFDENVLRMFRGIYRTEGVRGFFSGLSPTLWRDVPFSAFYWYLFEKLRRLPVLQRANTLSADCAAADEHSVWHDFPRNLTAGATAGTLAAILTHPFDVAKTKRQMILKIRDTSAAAPGSASYPHAMPAILRRIAAEQGVVHGLYAGLLPRVAKVTPSCAVMIASYEVGVAYFEKRQQRALLR